MPEESEASSPPPLGFDEAFALYYRVVYRTSRAIMCDAALAEDVAQEVFLRLHHNFDAAVRAESLRAWLLRVTTNVARNMLRGQHRAASREDRYAKVLTPDGAPPSSSDDELARRIELKEVMHTLRRVREPLRSCLLLKQQGLSYKEIAAALSIKESSVGTLLARAQREFLRYYGMAGGRR
jgi:RNA polymerase sigma factor (sigma-70 family)